MSDFGQLKLSSDVYMEFGVFGSTTATRMHLAKLIVCSDGQGFVFQHGFQLLCIKLGGFNDKLVYQ